MLGVEAVLVGGVQQAPFPQDDVMTSMIFTTSLTGALRTMNQGPSAGEADAAPQMAPILSPMTTAWLHPEGWSAGC